jgi:hypothetical protein
MASFSTAFREKASFRTRPSVATEFEILLPGSNDEPGVGASWLGIVSQDGPGDRSTSTLALLSRESIAPACLWVSLLKGRTIGKSARQPG